MSILAEIHVSPTFAPGRDATLGTRLIDLVEVYVSERCRGGHFRPSTAASVGRVLLRFARDIGADRDPATLRRGDLVEWLGSRDVAPGTLRNQHGKVASFLTWLVLTERIAQHPMTGMKPPPEPRRLPRGLPLEAVSKLIGSLDARGQLVVSLMVQEGLRDCEVCGLQVADIDFDNNAMLITGKGGHQRVLPISDETLGYLRRYLAEDPVSAGPIIRSLPTARPPGRPIKAASLSNMVSEWMTAAGIKKHAHDGVSAHALRHTCATDMLRGGAHVRDVQAALGHRSLSTTSRYLPWVTAPLKDAMSGRRYGR